ncbi:MAG TPA: hypothetical protein VK171_15750, partial [Fimbriimonas sp.]|nr:hypothetical protein [Fimbriimonas sp.]
MSQFRSFKKLMLASVAAGVSAVASADWVTACPGPPNTPRFSVPYVYAQIFSDIFWAEFGAAGTIQYASVTDGGCFQNAVTGPVNGRIGFGAGLIGSSQTAFDDLQSYTWGLHGGVMTRAGYAIVTEDTTSSMFGANGFNTFFTGSSDTYVYGRTTNGNVQIDLRLDLVGDAARLEWLMTNTDPTNAHTIGLGFGQYVSLFSEVAGPTPNTYVTVPGQKPPRLEQRFNRLTDPSGYPSSAFFYHDYNNPIGFRVENMPNDATKDPLDDTGSQTPTDGFVLGNAGSLLGALGDTADPTAFPNFIFQEPKSDIIYTGNPGYIQTWNPASVAAGSSRKIVAFYRTSWGDSLYGKPYSIVVDTPKVINLQAGDANAFANNPFNVRVYIDNNRGFATTDQEIPMQDINVELLLPDGLTAVGSSVRTINRIDARNTGFVDFTVQADPFVSGDLAYQVRVTPNPGPQKLLTGSILVVAQPKMILRANANLVTAPWNFAEPVWESILGMAPDQDYQAFYYDPVQKAYLISTGPRRGYADWIVTKADANITLGGTPAAPTDYVPQPDGSGGAPLITLNPGWNMIGNPYHVSFQLGEIVGVSQANPNQSYTFAQLVQQGVISGSLAFWDTATSNYRYIQNASDRVEPQKGYWIYVFSSQNVILRYPAIYQPGVRSIAGDAKPWTQSDKQWRLQLTARSKNSADDQNFVGVATNAANSKSLRVYEPPMAPLKDSLSLAVEKNIEGSTTKLAQSLAEGGGRQEFKVTVDSREKGPVTVTWPNLSTIPKNVRVRLVDVATGETRDLRKVSGYTFQADANLT